METLESLTPFLISLGVFVIFFVFQLARPPLWIKLGIIGLLFGLIVPRVMMATDSSFYFDEYFFFISPIFCTLYGMAIGGLFVSGFKNKKTLAKTLFILLLLVFIIIILISIFSTYMFRMW